MSKRRYSVLRLFILSKIGREEQREARMKLIHRNIASQRLDGGSKGDISRRDRKQ